MKNKTRTGIIIVGVALALGMIGCSTREAATTGAMVGRRAGTALGSVVVAVEETFNTAKDVQQANPRWDHQPNPHQRVNQPTAPVSPTQNQELYYYQANVLVETQGPANIVSIDVSDTKEARRFWQED
jgi:hypothetical protein